MCHVMRTVCIVQLFYLKHVGMCESGSMQGFLRRLNEIGSRASLGFMGLKALRRWILRPSAFLPVI